MTTTAGHKPGGERGTGTAAATAPPARHGGRGRARDHAPRSTAQARPRGRSRPAGGASPDEPHRRVLEHLGWSARQYTPSRRALVEFLSEAGGPVGIDEILGALEVPQSSVYRNLGVLEQAGAVTRLPAVGGHARYELSEVIVGQHHHLICNGCGRIEDRDLPDALEDQVHALLESLAVAERFRADSHRLEIFGLGACCS
jgi:Fe2+ or Zn2+ uptake regulation protein